MIKKAPEFSIAPFRVDITPPLYHSLLGGLVRAAIAVDDRLEAIGYVLLGPDEPIVVCALDWAGLLNDAHAAWRTALAEAAHTVPSRVAVQCIHQHSAPLVCPVARAAAAQYGDLPQMFDVAFFNSALDRVQGAVRAALCHAQPVTHVAHGCAAVQKVASNRRIARDSEGHIVSMRGSSCTDPDLRAMPEGIVDPLLRTVAFFRDSKKLVACHYYATHPMSFYRDGRVTSDFCGLARKRRQADEPDCTHIYFTGCAGDVGAGKYNDGSLAARIALTQKIYAGIVASEAAMKPNHLTNVDWRTVDVLPPLAGTPTVHQLTGVIADPRRSAADRYISAFRLSWLVRHASGTPLLLSCLGLNEISVLHLPGEMFVEYQLRAQTMRPRDPVMVAGYGDGGPWYLPTKEEYAANGYEVGVAFCSEAADALLTAGIHRLLA